MSDDFGFSDDLVAAIDKLNSLEEKGNSEAGRQAAEKELAGLDFYQVAANSKEERDPRYIGEIEGLLRTNNIEGLKARLGEEKATQIQEQYNTAWKQVEADRNMPRSGPVVAKDSAIGVGTAILNGALNAEAAFWGSPIGEFMMDIGGIGEGSPMNIKDQFAADAVKRNTDFNKEIVDPALSSTVRNQRKLVGLLDRQDERDHELSALEEGEAARGEFLPTLGAWTGRVGADAVSGAENTLTNPTMATQGTADAMGSMILAGGVSKGLGLVGESVVANKTNQLIAQHVAAGVERTAAEKLALEGVKALQKRVGQATAAASIGTTEGVSAFQQQAQRGLGTSLDTLTENSPAYIAERDALINQGTPFEEAEEIARMRVANKSANVAGLGTAVTSSMIGALLPEGAQKTFSPVRGWGQDAVREGVEETLQGGFGALIGNQAQQEYVDSKQDVLSGVGTQAGAGGVLGILSSGTLKAPGGVAGAVRATGSGLSNLASKRADAITASSEANSPGSVQGIAQRTTEVRSTENREVLTQAARDVIGQDTEADQRLQSQLTGLINSGVVTSLPGSASSLSEEDRSRIPVGKSRAETVDTVARMLLAEKDPKKAADLSQVFSDLMQPVQQFRETSGELERLRGSQEAMGAVGQYQGLLADIAALPAVQKAQERMVEVLAAGERTPASLAALATVDPSMGGKVSAAEVSDVLAHAQAGTFTDAQQAALKGSLALLQAREAQESRRLPGVTQDLLERHLGGDRNVATTSRQATVEMNPAHTEDGKYSARVHVDRIIQSMMSGNIEQATAYLEEFGNFVQHFQNKVGALNKSVQHEGKEISYQQYVGDGKFVDSLSNPKNYKHKFAWVNLKSEKSIKTAQTIGQEASLLGKLYDGLRQAYPELNAKELKAEELVLETKSEPVEKKEERRNDVRPEKAQTKVEPRNDRPTSPAIENLRSRLQTMTARDRARLVGTDYVTGLRTRASWEESPRSGKPVMVLTSTAVKPINDDPNGGHDVTNDFLRVMGTAISKIDPNAARSGTNFLLETDLSPQQVMDEVRKSLPDSNIELAAGVGPTLEDAFQNEKATTQQLRDEGKLPQRGQTAFDLKKLEGIRLPEGKAAEKLSQQTVNRVRNLSNEDFQSKVLEDPVTPGVLSGVGWRLIPRKAFVASIDLKGLKKLNDTIGQAFGDKYLELFSIAGLEMGGAQYDFAHLSGDEYAVQADSEQELWDWLHKLEAHLEANVKLRGELNGEEIVVTPAMRREVGTSYGDADKRLNTAKRAELAAAAAQQAAQAGNTGRVGEAVGEPQQQAGVPGDAVQGTVSDEGRGEVGTGGSQQESTQAQVVPQTTAERFPNLFQVPGKVRNMFAESQRLRPDSTRTMGTDTPIQTVRNAISSQDAFRKFVGQDPKGTLSSDVIQAYQGYLTTTGKNLANALYTSLHNFLQSTVVKGGKTFEQAMKDGEYEATTIQRGKPLNLVELGPDGKFRYNSALMGGAILAALQWQLSATQRQPVSRPQEIAEEIGVRTADDVPFQVMKDLSEGMDMPTAKQSLAQYVRRFWGVRPNPDAPMGFSDAIPESMASELIQAMEQAGIIKVNKTVLYYDKEGNLVYPFDGNYGDAKEAGLKPKVIVRYVPVDSKSALNEYPELLEETVVKQPEFASYYGDDAPPVADRQLANSQVQLSDETKTALTNMQAQKFYLNMPLVEGILQLGEDSLVELFGNPLPKDADKGYNKEHLRSLESQNVSLRGALKELKRLVGEMRNKAGSGDVSQLGKRYQYAVNSVNRIMMLGAHNPQADKLMREMILPTWSKLDMSNQEGEHYRFFMHAFAQAMKQKVHQKSLDENVKWSEEAVSGSLAPVLGVLSSWLRTKDAFPVKQYKTALEKAGIENDPLTTMALTEMARYQNSTDEQKKVFETPMYLESDGMTNGPFNSMGLLAVDEVTEEDIQNWRRGGLSVGAEAKTADQLRKAVNKTDLYKEGMNAAQVEVNSQLKTIQKQKDGGPILSVAKAMFNAMNLLLDGEVSWDADKNEWQFERGLGKNPSTVLVYGSGNQGIANKLVSRVTNAFYEKLSVVAKMGGTWEDAALEMFPKDDPAKALYKTQQLRKAMDMLAGVSVGYSKDEGKFYLASKAKGPVSQQVDDSPQNFKFGKEEQKRMETNMLHLLVNPMKDGIRRVLGPSVFASGDLLVKATQFQSIVAREMYLSAIEQLVESKIEKRAKEYSKTMSEEAARKKAKNELASEFLSKKELDGIWQKLKDIMPMVENDGQRFLIAKSDLLTNGMKSGFEYSRALDGSFQTEPYAEGIAAAGVTARPYLTIGMGDARMVRKVFEQGLDGAMQVFDGINIPVDKIGEYGSRINQAAMQAWQANVFSSVAETFKRFMDHPEFKKLAQDEKFIEKLSASKINPMDATKIFGELTGFAKMQEARNKAISKFALSMDQMAGTYKPHVTQGIDLSGQSDTQVREAINQEIRKNLETKVEAPKVEGVLHQSGASVYGKETMPQFLKWLQGKVTKEEGVVLREIFKSGNLKNTKVVMGTSEQVQAYQKSEGYTEALARQDGRQVNGYYSPSRDTIYLLSNNVETAVHELIHAGTFKQVLGHYQGKHNGNVQRLEQLMNEFLKNSLEDDGEVSTAYNNAKKEILSYTGRTDAVSKASALNEFMAWSLANRALVSRLSNPDSVLSKLTRIAKSAYETLVKMVTGKSTTQVQDFASQVRFNTALVARETTVESMVNNLTLAHSTVSGSESSRLTELSKAFSEKVARYLSSNPMDTTKENSDSLALAKETATRAQVIFDLNAQASDTFQMMVMAFATQANINPQVMIEAQKIYEHFLKNMTQEDFMTGIGDEQNDRDQADRKFEFIAGNTQSSENDPSGRSTLLSSFLALAVVDDKFRSILAKKAMPVRGDGRTVTKEMLSLKLDSALEVAGQKVMDALSDKLTEVNHPESVRVAIDQLTQSIIKTTEESMLGLVEKLAPTNLLHTWNDKVAGMLERAGQTSLTTGRQLGESRNPIARGAATVLKTVAILSSEKSAAVVAEEVLTQMDKHPGIASFFKDVVADMIGRTGSQANVYDMIKRVRTLVSQTRQAYRENVPAVITSKFKTEPTPAQWNLMYNVMGRYDMASLLESRSVTDTLQLAGDTKALGREISRLESEFGHDAQGQRYLEKINQYVNFVLTGQRGSNLLRNAYAISELLGEAKDEDFNPPTASTVKDIDELITLRLLAQVPDSDRDQFSKLLTEENEGMEFTLNYLKGQRKTEMSKATEGMSRFNHYKGVMPAKLKGRGHIVVVDDTKFSHMQQMGYERMGTYNGSTIDNRGRSQSYWYSPEGGIKTTFNQGIAQNVQGTAYGVRTETGTSLENNAGIINDPALVKVLAKKMHRESDGPEVLSPVYNSSGSLVAFERTLDPKYTKMLYGEQHLAKMIGEWKGRQVEENWAGKVNQELLGHLHKMYEDDTNKDRYVNLLGDDLDPVVKDAVSIMPGEVKAMAERQFGKGQFMVRRNLLNSVVGYRNASVGDLWTGVSRWSPKLQEEVRKVLMAMPGLGENAYRRLVLAERNWQVAMAGIRTNIVVRSLIVPAANFMSGIMQLNVRGIPLVKALRAVPGKVAELEFYSKTMSRKIELEAERFANENDVTVTRKIDGQLTALNDSLKRLSIWPLIEAGEFSTISDVGQTAEALGSSGDTMLEKITKAVDELPPGIRDMARQGYMARDTALFQALQKSVQYSDFVMKAIYFDHLKGQGQSNAAALSNITEEFNNYDVLPGRDRGYVESIGLAWFLNYKIRATKIGLSMVRKNPLSLMLYTMLPHPTSIGIPGTDNLVTSLMELSMGRSFGPGMATSPISLNPWYNLVAN